MCCTTDLHLHLGFRSLYYGVVKPYRQRRAQTEHTATIVHKSPAFCKLTARFYFLRWQRFSHFTMVVLNYFLRPSLREFFFRQQTMAKARRCPPPPQPQATCAVQAPGGAPVVPAEGPNRRRASHAAVRALGS